MIRSRILALSLGANALLGVVLCVVLTRQQPAAATHAAEAARPVAGAQPASGPAPSFPDTALPADSRPVASLAASALAPGLSISQPAAAYPSYGAPQVSRSAPAPVAPAASGPSPAAVAAEAPVQLINQPMRPAATTGGYLHAAFPPKNPPAGAPGAVPLASAGGEIADASPGSAETAAGSSLPADIPAVLAEPDPRLELTPAQRHRADLAAEEFVSNVDGGTGAPDDPNYQKKWMQARSFSDEEFKMLFGNEAFLIQQSRARSATAD